ncbi:MAG: hypothetical protein H0U40_04315 [Chloroflexia bacterium]|nr:hypothetical protein [Chloroflexia bacterium]
MSTWQATALSVSPPSRQVADTDRTALTFTAGEAITAATAILAILPAGTATTGLVETTTVDTAANTATVVVSGLARGVTYELSVTFTRADLTRWTNTLVLICVS